MTTILTSLLFTGLILSIIALILGGAALIMIIGVKNSTHSVQWVPIDEKDALDAESLEKKLNAPFEELEDDENIAED